MKIAILGWGSLVWDPRNLAIVGDWHQGGPILPIEFSRKSANGRLTLVIDPANGAPVATRFARSSLQNLDEAIRNLREREGNPLPNHIGYINLVKHTERPRARQNHPAACDAITVWARENDWEAVIWTALPSNFEAQQHQPFTVQAGLDYLNGLTGETRARAFEYIRRAPPETMTPLRRQFNAMHGENPGN